MGDRTEMSGFLYEVPKGKAKLVAYVLEEWGVTRDWDEGVGSSDWDAAVVRDCIEAGIQFTDTQWGCGRGHELAKELKDLGVTFEFHEDPKYEWMGDLHMFHPELGEFYALCDADGEVQISAHVILELEKKYPKVSGRWVRLRELLGADYIEAFRKLLRKEET